MRFMGFNELRGLECTDTGNKAFYNALKTEVERVQKYSTQVKVPLHY